MVRCPLQTLRDPQYFTFTITLGVKVTFVKLVTVPSIQRAIGVWNSRKKEWGSPAGQEL